MIIRAATQADSHAIARFVAMAESEMVHFFCGTDDIEAAAPMMEKWVVSPTRNRYSLDNNLVAEIDGEPAGSIICFPADTQPDLDSLLLQALNKRGLNLDKLFIEGEKGSWYLSTMGVDPKFRGKGVGSALMDAAMAKGRERGYKRVSLLVSKGKPRARTLYERVGFVVAEEVVMGNVQYYRMHKEL